MPRIDPTDIPRINEHAKTWAAGHEIIQPIAIDRIVIADDALDALVDLMRSVGRGGRTLMVADRTDMRRGGDDLKGLLESRLAGPASIDVCRLPIDPQEAFHADLDTARKLASQLADYAVVLSVGSGSVTDVVKYARRLAVDKRAADLPFICFPTAASVTAFTSALAVLTINGVKRTLPARPPDAVVCDLRTLAATPRVMTQAGFGDVLARSVAYGDWFIAGQLGMDDGFSHVPGKLLASAEQAMIDAAELVAATDLTGVRAVTEAVLLAGMAMSLVNQTAPISGWEHVISHFLDMTADHDGRALALHGGQVGVATLVVARAYERAWAQLDLDRITADVTEGDIAAYRAEIQNVFSRYDPSGKMAAEVWRDYERKLNQWRTARSARQSFATRKASGEFDAFLRGAVRASVEIEDALHRAAAPRRFADLNVPIPASAARAAVRHGHLIRARFTLGDLLDQTGWLDQDRATTLLDEPPT